MKDLKNKASWTFKINIVLSIILGSLFNVAILRSQESAPLVEIKKNRVDQKKALHQISSPKPQASPIKKKRKPVREKETEGSEAADRFEKDTVIKSPYQLDGEQLEVDPD